VDLEVAPKKIGDLLEGCAARERLVIEQTFLLQDGDSFKEESSAVHVHAHEAQIGLAGTAR
jgi:hypothetical protein